jgi:hypothetical protein
MACRLEEIPKLDDYDNGLDGRHTSTVQGDI